MIEVGHHLVRAGEDWHLRFAGAETKTGQPVHLVVPRNLAPFLGHYLAEVRPAIPGAAAGPHLWPACKGRPMAQETIYMRVRMRTETLLGTALSPHAFRSLAATFLAEASPADALHARPLLGHRQPATTERHYIRASEREASRAIATRLRAIRDA